MRCSGRTLSAGCDTVSAAQTQAVFKKLRIVLQFSPLPRDGSGFVRAISAFDNGKVIFKLKKTDELLEYLKARDFILL